MDESMYSTFMDEVKLLGGSDPFPAFQRACRRYIQERMGSVSDEQFEAVFGYAWAIGHSGGYVDVGIYLDDILDILVKFKEKV